MTRAFHLSVFIAWTGIYSDGSCPFKNLSLAPYSLRCFLESCSSSGLSLVVGHLSSAHIRTLQLAAYLSCNAFIFFPLWLLRTYWLALLRVTWNESFDLPAAFWFSPYVTSMLSDPQPQLPVVSVSLGLPTLSPTLLLKCKTHSLLRRLMFSGINSAKFPLLQMKMFWTLWFTINMYPSSFSLPLWRVFFISKLTSLHDLFFPYSSNFESRSPCLNKHSYNIYLTHSIIQKLSSKLSL